jgi:hypothetical protein
VIKKKSSFEAINLLGLGPLLLVLVTLGGGLSSKKLLSLRSALAHLFHISY